MQILQVQIRDKSIASEVVLGNTFYKRLAGLASRSEMTREQGLLLFPCKQVHTFGMSFPIDVVFLSKDNEIIHIETSMQKNHVGKYFKNAFSVLELCSGVTKEAGLSIGDRLEFI